MKDQYAQYYQEGETAGEAVARLVDLISLLRSPEGCPWDQAQTHESLKTCLLEEAYEVMEAINKGDMGNLEEELGDLLLQVVFHGLIGAENQAFDMKSIANRVCDKMLRRHPHVFLNKNSETIDKALEKWENMKRKERGVITHTQSMMDIPKTMPALMRSYKLQKKAADVGFDWEHVADAFSKVKEETQELLEACQEQQQDKVAEEVGDLLFSVVNVARFLGVDPEDALNSTSSKFIRRFGFIEEVAGRQGKSLDQMSLEEMDKLWEEAKRLSRNHL